MTSIKWNLIIDLCKKRLQEPVSTKQQRHMKHLMQLRLGHRFERLPSPPNVCLAVKSRQACSLREGAGRGGNLTQPGRL